MNKQVDIIINFVEQMFKYLTIRPWCFSKISNKSMVNIHLCIFSIEKFFPNRLSSNNRSNDCINSQSLRSEISQSKRKDSEQVRTIIPSRRSAMSSILLLVLKSMGKYSIARSSLRWSLLVERTHELFVYRMNSLRDDVEPLQRRMSFTATDTPPLSVVASSNRPTIDKIRNFGSRFSSMVSRQAAPTLTKLTTQGLSSILPMDCLHFPSLSSS